MVIDKELIFQHFQHLQLECERKKDSGNCIRFPETKFMEQKSDTSFRLEMSYQYPTLSEKAVKFFCLL